MGGNFKFQVQDSFLEYFFFEIWRSEKQITLSEKKPPLGSLSSFLFYFFKIPDKVVGKKNAEECMKTSPILR